MGSHWKLCSIGGAGLAAASLVAGCNFERRARQPTATRRDSLTAAKEELPPRAMYAGFTTRGDIAPLGEALGDARAARAPEDARLQPAQRPAAPGVRRGRSEDARQPAVPVLPARQQELPAERLHDLIKGVNDTAMLTSFGANCGLPTIGSVRLELEPKPGLPTDPDDIRAFIDVFTDIRACSSSTTRAAGTRAG